MDRVSKDEYALSLAYVVRMRSEDPYLKVGAVAMTREGRIIATGYNGLKPGSNLSQETWNNRELRRDFIIHAEMNICSLIKRGDAVTIAVTSSPCLDCAKNIVAHGFERVIFCVDFRDRSGLDLLSRYGILCIKLDHDRIKNIISSCLSD